MRNLLTRGAKLFIGPEGYAYPTFGALWPRSRDRDRYLEGASRMKRVLVLLGCAETRQSSRSPCAQPTARRCWDSPAAY